MKKLLLVLLVVTLASFLFVGCIPSVPAEGEGEGEGEVGICPTVSVTSEVTVGTKTYIKGGKQTITVTFAVPTEPVSVYVGSDLKSLELLLTSYEVVMYANADKTEYTGDFVFSTDMGKDCNEAYIYIETCETCDACKYPYTVDTAKPYALIDVTAKECVCAGIEVTLASGADVTDCSSSECCDDDCSGLASWSIDFYAAYPFDICCDTPCVSPVASCSLTACPVSCTTVCLATDGATGAPVDDVYYVVTTILDEVGNQTRYYTTMDLTTGGLTFDATTKIAKVPVVRYYQDKAKDGVAGKKSVCSWMDTPSIIAAYSYTNRYGFCEDTPDNVILSIVEP